MSNKKSTKEKGIKTILSYHPDWDLSVQEKYVFQYNHQKLPLLQPDQLQISGINMYQYDDGFVVTAFLRSSFTEPVSLDVIDLVLVDEKNNPLAKKSFEMDLLGELPYKACRPWRFLFENEHKLVEDIPKKGWQIVFEVKKKMLESLPLDLAESWKESLNEEQLQHLENIVKNLPPLREDEVNFMGLEAKIVEEKGLAATLLIRNASERSIFIDSLPLEFADASGEVIASATFELNQFEVKGQTCKPWTFVFPKSSIRKENLDISKWKAYVPQSATVDVKHS